MAEEHTDRTKSGSFRWLRALSSGLITGAADDDPSGVATYSQVGAKFGYATLWTMFLALPLMIAIQIVSARIGRVTGKSLADNMRTQFPGWIVTSLVGALVVANVINLGADVGAMGSALQLLIGGPAVAYALGFGLLSTLLQVFIPFSKYSPILKILTISLFAYVATIFVVKVPWSQAIHGTFVPSFQWTADYATAIVAILGTTISPFLFFWQAASEVEELKSDGPRRALAEKPSQGKDAIERINVDTVIGMVFSNVVAFFIILTAAAVLHAHGNTDIHSSAEAASALKPIAGPFAFWLFAGGIIGTGMLAVPVLAGATAYAWAGATGNVYGLEHKPQKAKFFYIILIGAMAMGAGLNLTPIDPFKALYWSAVINGVAAVPIMVAVMLLAQKTALMKKFAINGWVKWIAWLATAVMAAAAVVMFCTLGSS
ncbi:NRAMP (natural resistance-associated macrophage protein)-like metal ion transporter [Rhodanobacter sp. ANJX3]|uniref:NRAMP family divalent metal transporter n=1 Tax=Rhodanobacter sp. ANJX3 TaxID=2723083 RepID=UPI00161FF3CE|nr:divalent metal cation transporter [Rhodanobacter sp. ANJX3]MBB5358636.1 NRAMP (natural resistance-associated macrophage protein)-like metal ion transporter [Rhodanobacter sp. ANJX3]